MIDRHKVLLVYVTVIAVRMKKEQQEICDNIRLTQVKMSENEKVLYALHSEHAQLKHKLVHAEHNLKNDVDCLPLRREPPASYDGPIITVPFITS